MLIVWNFVFVRCCGWVGSEISWCLFAYLNSSRCVLGYNFVINNICKLLALSSVIHVFGVLDI